MKNKNFDPEFYRIANPKGLYVILQHNQTLHSLKGSTFFETANVQDIFEIKQKMFFVIAFRFSISLKSREILYFLHYIS